MEKREPKLPEIEDSFRLNIFKPNPQLIEDNDPPEKQKSSSNTDFDSQERLVEKKLTTLFTLRLEPEKKLTLFALRLAVLEKAASGLGALGFIWATVVLLGGFAVSLEKIDFWFITTILLIEGTRIFSRSHELEWQHQATWLLSDAGLSSFRLLKYSSDFLLQSVKSVCHSIPRIPHQSHHDQELTKGGIGSSRTHSARFWSNRDGQEMARDQTSETSNHNVPLYRIFLSKNTSKILYWLQISSASASVTLSLVRLIKQNFGEMGGEDSSEKAIRDSALNIFYALAFSEAMLSLLEKAYCEWRVTYCKLMEEVHKECELGPSGMVSIRKFFYDTYSSCISGSIFDGLKMNLASFGTDLLTANSYDEQLIGARILRKFTANKRFYNDTLRRISISMAVMERLVEMLNWKAPEEEEIRRSAAEILSKLAGKKQSSIRVAAIPGAMESISSLLHINRTSAINGAADEICEREVTHDQENYEFSAFSLLGLLILKKLAREHENCEKIGTTRGLLSKIVDFTYAGERLLRDKTAAESQISTVKRSLQVLKMLVTTTGPAGKLLRRQVSEIVFTIINIREILHYGDNHEKLQKLGIEIQTCLALEEDTAERIGSTGGVLKQLFNIFFNHGSPEILQINVRAEAAGEALAMLALESERNSCRILKLNVVSKLVEALEDPILRTNSARTLMNMCSNAGPNCFIKLKGLTASAPFVFGEIMSGDQKLQEVMLGLAAQILTLMDSEEVKIMFEEFFIKESEIAMKLVQILKHNQWPQIRVPRLRRFAIELAICMMKENEKIIQIFMDLGMKQELENVAETTSEVESFKVFSGSVGFRRYETTIQSLVDTALQILSI